MSTFLVSFGVVAATIAAVVYVVLNGPDQPPTIQRQPSRAEARRARRKAAQASRPKPERVARPVPAPAPAVTRPPALVAAGPVPALPDSDIMRLRVLPARRTTLWVRIRSGVVLMVLVAILGALLALVIGGVGLGLVFLIRSATG